MSIHDRDYVREKDFDYKKMEYENQLKNTKITGSKKLDIHAKEVFSNIENSRDRTPPSYKIFTNPKELNPIENKSEKSSNIPFYYYLVFIIIGILIGIKNN